MTSNVDSQIITAYEQEGMSPAEIAEDQDLNEIAVKAKLMACSSKYRKDCGKEPLEDDRKNYSDSQLEVVTQRLYELALTTEDEHLQFKVLSYIRDDKKGRKEAKTMLNGANFNILQINESLAEANKRARLLTEKKELVDV